MLLLGMVAEKPIGVLFWEVQILEERLSKMHTEKRELEVDDRRRILTICIGCQVDCRKFISENITKTASFNQQPTS
jgi:hypothetical protein